MDSQKTEGDETQAYQAMKAAFNLRTVEQQASYLLPHIQSTMRILDLGCGTASITVGLAKLVPQGSVVGVDISHDMLAWAESTVSQSGVSNIELVQDNALQYLSKQEPESFDIVHMHQVLLHLPEPVAVLRQIRTVLRNGGILAARDNAARVWHPYNAGIDMSQIIFERMSRASRTDPLAGKRTHVWANEAGFEWSKMLHSAAGWHISDAEEKRVWSEGAMISLRKPAMNGRFATEEELNEVRDGWHEWAKTEGSWWAGLDGEILCWK
jgi:ubiquinone/menaquinone biosynthesis C-methylase UbiE